MDDVSDDRHTDQNGREDMMWWGHPWPSEKLRAPVCENDAERTAAPLGSICPWCEEPCLEGEGGVWMPHYENEGIVVKPWHQECSFRSVMGSKAHLEGRCSCFGHEEPELEMTRREESRWVYEHWTSMGEIRRDQT